MNFTHLDRRHQKICSFVLKSPYFCNNWLVALTHPTHPKHANVISTNQPMAQGRTMSKVKPSATPNHNDDGVLCQPPITLQLSPSTLIYIYMCIYIYIYGIITPVTSWLHVYSYIWVCLKLGYPFISIDESLHYLFFSIVIWGYTPFSDNPIMK